MWGYRTKKNYFFKILFFILILFPHTSSSDINKELKEINANIIWIQEGIVDENAASLAIKSGLKVVMNKCPKKILES